MSRKIPWAVASAIGVVLAVPTGCTGTIVVDSSRDGIERFVEFHGGGTASSDGVAPQDGEPVAGYRNLPSRSRRKFLVPTRWFFETEYLVKPTGLPAISVELGGLTRRRFLISPESFYRRPVLLLKPRGELIGAAEGAKIALEVTVNNDVIQIYPYRGNALWVGCEKDVAVPQHRRERWQREGGILDAWLQPDVLTSRVLSRDDVVRITAYHLENEGAAPSGEVVEPISVQMRRVEHVVDFPQEIDLEVKE